MDALLSKLPQKQGNVCNTDLTQNTANMAYWLFSFYKFLKMMSPHKYTRAHEERQIEEGVVHIRGDRLPLCQGRKGCSAGCSANGLWGKTNNSSNTSQSQDGSSDLIMVLCV